MFHLSIVCPQHRAPYQHVLLACNQTSFLRCPACPFHPASSRISTDLEHMTARMGTIKTHSRSKSKSKVKTQYKTDTSSEQWEEEGMAIVVQQQVLAIELAMKLLTEDKKKYYAKLEKMIGDHKKLWQQYNQSMRDQLFLSKLSRNPVLLSYTLVIREQGWANFDKVLKAVHNRSYVCKRIIKQSKEITEQVRNQRRASEQTVLRNLQLLVGRQKDQVCPDRDLKEELRKSRSISAPSKRSKSLRSY